MITTSLEVSLLILTIELMLIAIAAGLYGYFIVRKAKEKAIADATEFVNKAAGAEESRRASLETVFKEKCQYEGDKLAITVDEFMQREKTFYNVVVSAFLGGGKNKLSDLNDELIKVVTSWTGIMPMNMLDVEEAKALVVEKEKLETALVETKEELEKVNTEFARAFHTDDSNEGEEETKTPEPSVSE